MGAFTWKSVLLPPIFALALYALTTYLVLPYYRHLRARSSYSLLPSSQSSSNNPSLTTRLLSRIQALVGRSKRRASSNSLLGDEELEEGFDNLSDEVIRGRDDVAVDSDTEGDRRLSRELEGGFRDSSDEDDDDRGRGRR
ncbi:hypothetical protein HO173_000138 [Letharia columbiana]|uniref:Uncharacterized protein n=1 Tax=Letharia columbiana TaxID=112416 RepID=A0A8H6G6C7_9LECA|nr:uncharacterized protein HO173_000138 [Letharia columbiana]KAF6241428.1 hypothetical protein HO173_000138 [Letharia columbiana]